IFRPKNDRGIHQKLVIHDGNAKITNFGISKNMNMQNSTIHIGNFGRIPHVDPKKLLDLNFQYEKASDIYSYGVLMWEISSGVPPFKDLISRSDQQLLCIKIINGYRENIIEDTPDDYKELYEKCWDSIPEKRPSIKIVLEEFKKMGFGIENEGNEDSIPMVNEISNKNISAEGQTDELNRTLVTDDLSIGIVGSKMYTLGNKENIRNLFMGTSMDKSKEINNT
ncbi:3869_t:CDS:2, partial [Funneliformis mosseae]